MRVRHRQASRGSWPTSTTACRARPARVQRAVQERGRRRDHAGAHAGAERRLDRRDHRVRAAIGVEARDVEPERSARAHRCGSSSRPWSANSASCIGQNAPCSAAASAAQAAGAGARVRGPHREVPEADAHRVLAQLQLERRAVRALVVAVDDDQPSVPAHMIGGADRRQRGGAEVVRSERVEDQVGAGQHARVLGLVAPAHGAVGVDDHERALREPARVIDAERAARRALGLEVRELLDLDPELLLERASASTSRRTRRRRASRPCRRSPPAARCRARAGPCRPARTRTGRRRGPSCARAAARA